MSISIENYKSMQRAYMQNEMRKREIWNRTTEPINNSDHMLYAMDCFSNEIHYCDYGKKESRFGWELDHIRAQAMGGSDVITNLRALHWRENASLGGSLGADLKN